MGLGTVGNEISITNRDARGKNSFTTNLTPPSDIFFVSEPIDASRGFFRLWYCTGILNSMRGNRLLSSPLVIILGPLFLFILSQRDYTVKDANLIKNPYKNVRINNKIGKIGINKTVVTIQHEFERSWSNLKRAGSISTDIPTGMADSKKTTLSTSPSRIL